MADKGQAGFRVAGAKDSSLCRRLFLARMRLLLQNSEYQSAVLARQNRAKSSEGQRDDDIPTFRGLERSKNS